MNAGHIPLNESKIADFSRHRKGDGFLGSTAIKTIYTNIIYNAAMNGKKIEGLTILRFVELFIENLLTFLKKCV